MSKRRALFVVALVATLTIAAWAAKSAPATVTFLTPSVFGVHDDGNNTYDNGVGGVKAYFGVTRKDANLVTYNTGRKLFLEFDPSSAAVIAAGLPAHVEAEVDFFAINYYGPYTSMGDGTTAQVQMDLEFKVGNLTYELDYAALAAIREGADTWRVTSAIDYTPGFTASSTAKLNVIRRKSQTTYGTVEMPIEFRMRMK